MRWIIVLVVLPAVLGLGPLAAISEAVSPTLAEPTYTAPLGSRETCQDDPKAKNAVCKTGPCGTVKNDKAGGRLECHTCPPGYSVDEEIGCYRCPTGTTLVFRQGRAAAAAGKNKVEKPEKTCR